MSKEITAREIIKENLNNLNGLASLSVKNYAETGKISGTLLLEIEKSMEQYAQAEVAEENKRWLNTLDSIVKAKVLIALEKEVVSAYVQNEIWRVKLSYGRDLTDGEMASSLIEAKDHYETEVKPKYK